MKTKISTTLLTFFILVIGFSFSSNTFAGEVSSLLLKKDPQAIIKNLEILIPELIKNGRVPGLQIALIQEGKIIWFKSFGVKNNQTKEPVTENTIFEAASLTKPFFAFAVMKMVEEGVVDLDKPLIKYLPKDLVEKELGHSLDAEGFRKDWFEKITGRHVLSHSGGMPHGESGKTYPLFFEPGTKYKYSAAGYYFMQLVVEHLKGENLETIMKKYVLDPLGMGKSWMVWRNEYEKNMANGHGYFGNPEAFRKRSRAYSSATLYTTAEEYARFICAILNGEGLKNETLKKMLFPQIDVNREKSLTWSLGFGIQKDKNGTAFWQWGDYGIFRNYIIAYPQHKLAVVYLTNSVNGLSICPDIVSQSIGGQALGNTFLEYDHYNSELYKFLWTLIDQGVEVVENQLPDLKKKYPKKFSQRTIQFLGGLFLEEKLFPEAFALYKFNLKTHPKSGRAMNDLARVYLQKGDLKMSKEYYHKALKATEDKVEEKNINWIISYIKGLEKPVELSEDYLKKLAGDYETRHLKFKEGHLYYFRENVAATNYRKLIPISKDTFVIKELIFFRIKIEFDSQGNPVKITGLYENGNQDQSVRNK